jgi:hypothetical protein
MSKVIKFYNSLSKKEHCLQTNKIKLQKVATRNAEFFVCREPQEDKTFIRISKTLVRCGCSIIIVFH